MHPHFEAPHGTSLLDSVVHRLGDSILQKHFFAERAGQLSRIFQKFKEKKTIDNECRIFNVGQQGDQWAVPWVHKTGIMI